MAEPSVFLSYSSRDKDFVRVLTGQLTRAGLTIWQDERDLRVGQDLGAIRGAIAAAGHLVVVLSPAAAGSAWVRREVELADELGVPVLPALLADTPDPWAETRFGGLAHADFRRSQDLRRSTYRLVAAIQSAGGQMRFLRAKEAATLVREVKHPAGVLFGISQQGVSQLYCLTGLDDWEFADATAGTSRFWIVEFYDESTGGIHAYAVMDTKVHELPTLHVLGHDGRTVPDSIITYSCALNHLPGLTEEQAERIVAEHADEVTRVDRRYAPFRPVPLARPFVDSPVAVDAATESALAADPDLGRGGDLFVLVKLERDKRNNDYPMWTVAFFDPTLGESVLAVGVDAAAGTVRYPAMRAELLNARFFISELDADGNIVVSVANQLRAIDRHVWDRAVPGRTRLTAAEAVAAADRLLAADPAAHGWQLCHLSNTGIVQSVLSPHMASAADGLMTSDGLAGQWVVEYCGTTAEPVVDGARRGHRYAFRQFVVTVDGAERAGALDTLVLTVPLSAAPLPPRWADAYEDARLLAVHIAPSGFARMSVALSRTAAGTEWYFRCYDEQDIIVRITISADGRRVVDRR